jgi:hypothetical protein
MMKKITFCLWLLVKESHSHFLAHFVPFLPLQTCIYFNIERYFEFCALFLRVNNNNGVWYWMLVVQGFEVIRL